MVQLHYFGQKKARVQLHMHVFLKQQLALVLFSVSAVTHLLHAASPPILPAVGPSGCAGGRSDSPEPMLGEPCLKSPTKKVRPHDACLACTAFRRWAQHKLHLGTWF